MHTLEREPNAQSISRAGKNGHLNINGLLSVLNEKRDPVRHFRVSLSEVPLIMFQNVPFQRDKVGQWYWVMSKQCGPRDLVRSRAWRYGQGGLVWSRARRLESLLKSSSQSSYWKTKSLDIIPDQEDPVQEPLQEMAEWIVEAIVIEPLKESSSGETSRQGYDEYY